MANIPDRILKRLRAVSEKSGEDLEVLKRDYLQAVEDLRRDMEHNIERTVKQWEQNAESINGIHVGDFVRLRDVQVYLDWYTSQSGALLVSQEDLRRVWRVEHVHPSDNFIGVELRQRLSVAFAAPADMWVKVEAEDTDEQQ